MAEAALRKTPHAHSGMAIPFSPKTPFRKKIGWHITEGSIHAAVFVISPIDAGELMERNRSETYRNRVMSEVVIGRYAAEMKRGWRLTGEPIILSRSGQLLNGQHRLQACIDSGASFPTLVVFGIADDAFAFMDQGKKRSAADIFSIHGIGDYVRLAAATVWVWRYHNTGMGKPSTRSASQLPGPDQLYDYYLTHKALDQSCWVAPLFTKNKLATPSLLVALHYLCAASDPEAAAKFFRSLASGEDLKKGNPVFHLRNRLIDERLGGGSLVDIYAAAFIVQAWNAVRQGKKLGLLRWRTEKLNDLPFPTII